MIAAILSLLGLCAAGLIVLELLGRAAVRAEAEQPRGRGGLRNWPGSTGGGR
jgi:hypothetical protein